MSNIHEMNRKIKMALLAKNSVEIIDLFLREDTCLAAGDVAALKNLCKANQALLDADKAGQVVDLAAIDRAIKATEDFYAKLRSQKVRSSTAGDSLAMGGAVALVAGVVLRQPAGAAVGMLAMLAGKAINGWRDIRKATA